MRRRGGAARNLHACGSPSFSRFDPSFPAPAVHPGVEPQFAELPARPRDDPVSAVRPRFSLRRHGQLEPRRQWRAIFGLDCAPLVQAVEHCQMRRREQRHEKSRDEKPGQCRH